jgi:vacuolar-type H+-ATPase subunit F/Vma7
LLAQAGAVVARLTNSQKAAIITDTHLVASHADTVRNSVRQAAIEPIMVTIPAASSTRIFALLAGL